MSLNRTLCLFLAASTLGASSALVASPPGGGGGGGGMAPSMSGSQYDAAAEYRKGMAALQSQNYADAKKAFEHVLTVVPEDANSNFLAGLASAGLNDLKSARKYYERAVRADKDMVQAHQELGITYVKTGEKAKAQAELDRLNEMQRKCNSACAKAADIGKAIQALTAAIGSAPQARLETQPGLLFASAAGGDRFYLDAVGLINDHRYAEAIISLEKAKAAFGPHPDILTYLGFANRKLGRYDVAEHYYRAALAAAPHHRAATEYYGELMVERGNKAGAEKMLASLETTCTFGCAEADELRRWIDTGHAPTN
ncbi:MAG TPA: tetratricopeptide repeat protein [Allosphingosinicella sp.]|nr:tetratricopeptide repeat protein [Allosphingosinicella sp.]